MLAPYTGRGPPLNIDSPHQWPAEWETQAATWIAWPHNRATWPDNYAPIPDLFYQLVNAISDHQPVFILAAEELLSESHLQALNGRSNVCCVDIRTNDAWIRDFGPTFVKRQNDGALVGVCWKYNAWGNKYPPYDLDAAAATRICIELRCQRSMSAIYCEGGALEGNGKGTLLTTSSCLLNPNRNPGWNRKMVSEELRMQLGVRKIVWVDGGGLQGDDTDGHIDQIARFVKRNIVVAAVSSVENDPNRSGLLENIRILRSSTTAESDPLQVHTLPTPPPRFVGNVRVPESYCNFLITNKTVIVPTFRNDRTDAMALETFSELFPDRTIVPLDAYDLCWGLGAFHCASQQHPA